MLVSAGVRADLADDWCDRLVAISHQNGDGADGHHARAELDLLSHTSALLDRLAGDKAAASAVSALRDTADSVRSDFLQRHGRDAYILLTKDYKRSLRPSALLAAAEHRFPGLVPTAGRVSADAGRLLADKHGVEREQAAFFGHLLADPQTGDHLIEAARTAHPGTSEFIDEFMLSGRADLPRATVCRHGSMAVVEMSNPDHLNAEDDSTLESLEIAIDLVLTDPQVRAGVLRGAPVPHAKYAGQRVFSAGLNLTHLYEGRISYIFFLERELALVNKLLRGLRQGGAVQAKPWIAAVDRFAIGGGLQLLLAVDWVIAERGAVLSLPATVEGLIPGAANLRLSRFVGERGARRLLFMNQVMRAGDAEAEPLCDNVVAADELDVAIDRAVAGLLAADPTSLMANRQALLTGVEPDATFRTYMASYATEQARCLYGTELPKKLLAIWPPASVRRPGGDRGSHRGHP